VRGQQRPGHTPIQHWHSQDGGGGMQGRRDVLLGEGFGYAVGRGGAGGVPCSRSQTLWKRCSFLWLLKGLFDGGDMGSMAAGCRRTRRQTT
jgi:hypothetical protein